MLVLLPVSAVNQSAAASTSAIVADSPILLGSHPARTSSLWRQHSSCSPLSEFMKAWTSSIMMNLSSEKSLLILVGSSAMRFCRDSGVICRIPEGNSNSASFFVLDASPCHPVMLMYESFRMGSILSN